RISPGVHPELGRRGRNDRACPSCLCGRNLSVSRENRMAKKQNEASRRKFLKQSAALGVGALMGPQIYRDAGAASMDRITIYQKTGADSINPYNQSSGSIYGNRSEERRVG